MNSPRLDILDQRRLAGLLVDREHGDVVLSPDKDGLALEICGAAGPIGQVHEEFTFEGTALEVEQAIRQAYEVAEALRPAAAALPVIPREHNASFDHPVESYLVSKGFDVNEAAQQQNEASWAAATQEFLAGAGSAWPGGRKNMELIGLKIVELGLENAPDKVAALSQAYEDMQSKGLLFESDFTPTQAVEATADATPAEILEAWKQTQNNGDPEQANAEFIKAFRNGRSSGLFGK